MDPQTTQRAIRWTIVAVALAGAWVSGTLLAGHDGGWAADADQTPHPLQLCESPNRPSVTCADVVASRWGSFDVYVGTRRIVVPTSFIGLAYFVAVAMWAGLAGVPAASAAWAWRFKLLVATMGLVGAAFLTGLMVVKLEAWCPLCAVAHGLNAVVFAGVLALWWRTRKRWAGSAASEAMTEPSTAAWQRRLTGAVGVSIGVTIVGMWLYYDAAAAAQRQWRKYHAAREVIDGFRNDPDFLLRTFHAQPAVDARALSGSPGTKRADTADERQTLVVFTNYDCDACACFEARRHALIDRPLHGALAVEIRHYPHEAHAATGEQSDRPAGRETESFRASLAGEAARMQGNDQAFTKMRRLLFQHRGERHQHSYASLARRAGLDVERFQADVRGADVRRRVRADMALGRALGISLTPAVFLGSRRVPELCLQSPAFWEAIAEAEALRETLADSRANVLRGGAHE